MGQTIHELQFYREVVIVNVQQESCLIRRAYWKCNWGCGDKDGRLLKIGYAISHGVNC